MILFTSSGLLLAAISVPLITLDLPPGATKAQLEATMNGHVLAKGRLMGTYQR
jgi:phosphatidylethanolamine-binding protein (PEBP) family uncharacterized protein